MGETAYGRAFSAVIRHSSIVYGSCMVLGYYYHVVADGASIVYSRRVPVFHFYRDLKNYLVAISSMKELYWQ